MGLANNKNTPQNSNFTRKKLEGKFAYALGRRGERGIFVFNQKMEKKRMIVKIYRPE